MKYTIYKIINMINGKIYIGCHKTKEPYDDYMGSGKILKRAIKKYGIEHFVKDVLYVFDNSEDMFEAEATIVHEGFVSDKETYNLKVGGEGGWDNAIKARIKKYPEGMFKGKKHTDESKNKISLTKKRRYPDGTWKGKKHTTETKKLMSDKARERLKDPTKNTQYGTIWIYSEELKVSKKIKKESIVPEGWRRGRKIKSRSSIG